MSSFWNSTGLCRCCLAEGNFKNLESICVFDGKDETFLALLRETFEMNISNMSKQNESFYSICDVCEPKLLDSVQFKRQVMECEEKFIKYYLSREDFKDAVIENDIKLEVNVTFQQLGSWKTKMSNDFKEESGIAEEYDVNHEENESTSNLDTYDHNTDEDEPLSKLKKIKLKISKKKLKDDIENNYNDTKCDVTNNDDENETKPKFQRKQYPCEQCTKSFTYKGALEIHMNLHNGKKTFLCKLCNTPFLTNKEMNFHIREQHNIDGVYLCDVCKKKFEKPWQLKKHWVLHYPDKFPCKICGRQFVYKRGLKEHLLSHSGERRFICTVCNISFLHHQTLKQHAYTHTGERPHVCDICGRGFAQRSHLRRHIVIIHNKFKPASCKICNKEFSSKSYLAVHERLHTGEKPHSCEICNRNFSSLTTLRVHTRIHTGLKPYSCNFCSRQFSQSASFKLHLRIHTGERPYSCKVCSKPFADKSYLKQHQRIHTDDRPYCCDVCKRTFRESCQLKRHLRVHTGVKAYTCKVCNKQIGNLSKHMKVHDAERQFSCTVCNKQFSMSGNLKLHMRVHDKRDTAVLTAW